MLGAISGDIIGSRFEARPTKSKDFDLFTQDCRFTDDSVLTIALADSLLNSVPYSQNLKTFYARYPHAGYGGTFAVWAASTQTDPYYSFGNGSAMRVSPVGWFFSDEQTVLDQARDSAAVTHDHPEGIKGAQAVALGLFLARQGRDKSEIRDRLQDGFGYDLQTPLERIRPGYSFDVTCQGSVPQAITAFLESTDFEDAVRNAVSLGGDSDTQACMAGALAEAYYGGIPPAIAEQSLHRLDEFLRRLVYAFYASVIPNQELPQI
ncbi:ADP-ribosylglycohydrolase family protein [Desulfovermiculus halophilus]|jgi:ADP-ribosylglycohydrolase|uniref:ADP-ribosylglycohydrolase family protein n=1 Tax=Desulfovermiculus halophilus TaxID=339722 RepID=UPI00048800D6|nr:ADP-ribosylglycohydrolase family protein [Desulfovermiculus halophilus]